MVSEDESIQSDTETQQQNTKKMAMMTNAVNEKISKFFLNITDIDAELLDDF